MNYYIGIDNGISGGWAVVDRDGNLGEYGLVPVRKIGDMKEIDLNELFELIRKSCPEAMPYTNCDISIMLEQGQKQPIFGCKGNFANGYFFGRVSGALEVLNYKTSFVNPKTWQSILFKDIRGQAKGNTKGMSVEVCRRLFPKENIIDHNIADAVCIALYLKGIS